MSYTYKFVLDENGQVVYPRTVLSAVDVITANGIQISGDTMSIVFASKEQIHQGAAGMVISAEGLKEAISAYSDTLYIAGGGIDIKGGTVFAKPAPVNSLIMGTPNEEDSVTNGNLNGALDVGKAVDVTALPAGVVYGHAWTSVTEYTEVVSGENITENCIRLQATSASGYSCYGWDPLPNFIPGSVYLLMADVKAVTGSVRGQIGCNASGHNFLIYDNDGNPYGREDLNGTATSPFLTSEWKRMAICVDVKTPAVGIWFYNSSASALDIRIKHFKVFDVTNLPMEARYALASMKHPERVYDRYLVKKDEVCPWIEIHNLSTASTATIQAGLAYKLQANDGNTHTLTVDTLPADSYGRDAYITIFLDNTSYVVATKPLVIVDPLMPNAANNCVVKFRDGYARLYVTDTDYGFVVTVTSGTDSDSLYYGLYKTTEDYIQFAHSTDEIDCVVISGSSVVPQTAAPTRTIMGNGPNKTIMNFNNNVLKPAKGLTITNAKLTNASVTGGSIYIDNGNIGNLNLSSGLLSLLNTNELSGVVNYSGGTMSVAGTTINGTGISEIHFSSSFTNSLFGPLTLHNVKVTGDTIKYYPINCGAATRSLNVTDCLFTGIRQEMSTRNTACSGAVINASYSNITIVGSTFSYITNIATSYINSSNQTAYYETYGLIFVNGSGCSLTIDNCVFEHNVGRYCSDIMFYSGNSTITGTTITGSTATYAQIVYLDARQSNIVSNCLITGCTTGSYGNFFVYRAHALIKDTRFENNRPGVCLVYVYDNTVGNPPTIMSSCEITGNTGSNGTVIQTVTSACAQVIDCTINNNVSANEGLIYAAAGTTISCSNVMITGNSSNLRTVFTAAGAKSEGYMSNCQVKNNNGRYDIIFASNGGYVEVTDCVIEGNTTTSDSSALCAHVNGATVVVIGSTVTNNLTKTYATVHAASSGTLSATDCLVTGNTAVQNGAAFAAGYNYGKMYLTNCVAANNNVTSTSGNGNGGYFVGANTELSITGCTFGLNQDLWFGTSSSNNCKVSISGSNVFQAEVNGPYASFTIAADSVINLHGNPVENAIKGGTITALGALTIHDKDNHLHKYLARSVTTGSTITNMGLWLPAPGRLVVSTAGNYEVQGYMISDLTGTAHGVGATITAGTVSVSDMTITNNKFTSGTVYGGGIYFANDNTKGIMSNCTITNNKSQYGGGVFINITGCTVTVNNCVISNNVATAYGGGIQVYSGAYGIFTNCDISGNSSGSAGGGALANSNATVHLKNCNIHDNIGANAKGLHAKSTGGKAIIEDCTFGVDQTIVVDSGCTLTVIGSNRIMSTITSSGLVNINAGATIDLHDTPLTGNIVSGGTINAVGTFTVIDKNRIPHEHLSRSITGSTIMADGRWLPPYRIRITDGSSLDLTGTIVSGNSQTSEHGGGVYISSGSLTLTGGTISDNTLYNSTTVIGGGVYTTGSVSIASFTNCFFDNNYGYRGGCIQTDNKSTVNLIGCTVSNNKTGYYGAIRAATQSFINLTNCLITGNSAGQQGAFVSTGTSTISLTGCTIKGNLGGTNKGFYNDANGVMIIDGGSIEDPGFGDTTSTLTLKGNVHLLSTISIGKLILIASGTTINLTNNDNTNAISGGTITAQGSFIVIDKSGTSHSFTATTKTNSKITNLGAWS